MKKKLQFDAIIETIYLYGVEYFNKVFLETFETAVYLYLTYQIFISFDLSQAHIKYIFFRMSVGTWSTLNEG